MTCDEVRRTLPLFLYGELPFDEEERVEAHIDECDACREALDRERAMFRSLDAAEAIPDRGLLEECRAELGQRLAQAGQESGFWEKMRRGFSIHFHWAPGMAQPVGAVAMLLLGFAAARMMPGSLLGSWHAAGLVEPLKSRVRYVEPTAAGKIRIVVDETQQRVFSGDVGDQNIQRLLLVAAKDPADPDLRTESVGLLTNRSQHAEVRRALLYALQHDSDAGVRLKALDGLKDFADDPETRKTLTQVLLKDNNPNVRTQVIDLLIPHRSDAMVSVLQELMAKEDNDYIRERAQQVLHEMKASVETY